jgi:cytochrome bd-type quinol oxidase subunit 1
MARRMTSTLITHAFAAVGRTIAHDGSLQIENIWVYLSNPWAFVQFAHNQSAALVTGSFVVVAIGAFCALSDKHREQARLYHQANLH